MLVYTRLFQNVCYYKIIMSDERWYFSKEQLENSPSRKLGIAADEELNYKQLAANLIYDMGSGKLLSVNQLCISTAIVYVHRFYVFHSFSHFQWHTIAMASLFLAAKVEEQTRKLEHVIKTAQWCLQRSQYNINCASESYLDQVQELVMNENILLQTLGFDVNVKHPHTFVVEFCEKIKLNKDITKTMYGMASNSLNVTTMCVQYKPSVVACFCIHFICTWTDHRIKMKDRNQTWWTHIDPSVTQELLEQMIIEFLHAYERSPPKLKNKIQELLKCRNLSSHFADHKLNTTSRRSNDSFCHCSTSPSPSSSSSFASASMFQPQKHETLISKHSSHGSSRMHGLSTNYLSSHHQSSHPATNTSAITNRDINTSTSTQIPLSQHTRSNPVTHVSSEQQQYQYSQHQQNYHHRYHAGPTFPNSKHTHKTTSHGVNHDVFKPKMTTVSHSTNTSDDNVIPMTQNTMKSNRRMEEEISKKYEPERHFTIDSIEPISKPTCAAAGSDSHQKFDYSSGVSVASNIIPDISSAKSIEVKTELFGIGARLYAAVDTVDSSTYNVDISRPSRNHSIFSPSPVHNESALPIEIQIKQEISPVKEQIKQEPSSIFSPLSVYNEAGFPTDVQIKREIPLVKKLINPDALPVDLQIKEEPQMTNPSNQKVPFSGLPLNMVKIETVCDNENISTRYPSTVATSAYTSERPVYAPVITNVFSLAPPPNEQPIRKEPSEVKSEPSEYSKISSASNLPLLPRSSEKTVVLNDGTSITVSGEFSSELHRKMKNDKHHKEKKRHKDERHRHHKEQKSKEKQHKKLEPIKITIPKEKLTDIPTNVEPKINPDRFVAPSTSSKDFRPSNTSQNVSNPLKRKRESDHSLSSGTHSYSSQNDFKDCL